MKINFERIKQFKRRYAYNVKTANFGGFPNVSMGVHIPSEKKQPVYMLLRIFFAAAGIFGTVFTFLTAMENAGIDCFDKKPVLTAAVLGWLWFSAVYGSYGSRPEISKNTEGISLAALMLFGMANVRKIASGFMTAANAVLGQVYTKYHDSPLFDPKIPIADILEKNNGADPADYINPALCFFVLLIAAAACCGIVKKPNLIIFFAATFPLAETVLYFGLQPDIKAFALLCGSWCAVLAARITHMGIFAEKGAGELFSKTFSQSALAAFLTMLVCFGIGAALGSGHIRSDSAENFRTAFAVYMRSFSWEKFTEDLADAFLPPDDPSVTHDGKLGNVDSVEFDGDAMLYVSLPQNTENLYLKGFSAAEYQGSRWVKGEELPILESKLTSQEFFAARIMRSTPPFEGLSTQNVTVVNAGMSSSVRYYPSNAAGLLETDGKRRRYGVYFPSGNWQRQVIESAGYITLSGTVKRDEAAMRAYAYANCLAVPETFTAAEEFFEGYNGVSLYEELEYIRKKLASECSYDLTSGKKPFGVDFAQWFLTENKRGSCTHFATAAALLCRSRGIPARYCEGYIVKADDLEKTAAQEDGRGYVTVCVPDSRAHAWVEIYADNIGWIPFEATPGYGNIAVTAVNSPSGAEISETSVITAVETEPPAYAGEDMTFTTPVQPENAEGDFTDVTADSPVQTAVSDAANEPAGGSESAQGSENTEAAESGGNTGDPENTDTAQGTFTEIGAEDSEFSDHSNEQSVSGQTEGSGENIGNTDNTVNTDNTENPPADGTEPPFAPNGEQGGQSDNINDTAPIGQGGVYEQDGKEGQGGQTAPVGQGGQKGSSDTDLSHENSDGVGQTAEQTDSGNDRTGESLEKSAAGRVLLMILLSAAAAALVLAAVIFAVIGRRRFILKRRGRLCESSPEKAAELIYRMLASAAGRKGISLSGVSSEDLGEFLEKNGMPKGCGDIVSIALKARFGGGISHEELAAAVNAYNSIMTEIVLTGRDRFIYKYIRCSDKIR